MERITKESVAHFTKEELLELVGRLLEWLKEKNETMALQAQEVRLKDTIIAMQGLLLEHFEAPPSPPGQ